ncbi:cytochrome c1 [Halorhodospira neutriphila]|uniref:Cytochrome c domain-containing protein n=1 Tax=Halorhodospira neutriphila TaxID=168379 RepID=A0ABS1E5V5_9GAMM|nr:cytochrome c1 [Halorhodospira neutriphila]MBK1726589.1 hypothetical protein [Halorhodospira neutriphila]
MYKNKLAIVLSALFVLSCAGTAQGSSGPGMELMEPGVSRHDQASIRKGAEHFAQYCSGCHSVEYLRYQRVAEDVGKGMAWARQELMHGEKEPHAPILAAMDPQDGEEWFNIAPPDLSLTAREKSEAWIYTYLNTFYKDESAEVGFNNMVQPGTSMPHVLASLQGTPRAVRDDHGEVVGTEVPEGERGALSEAEYEAFTADLTAFLSYASQPIAAKRERIGIWVLLFLVVFTTVFYLLYKEYFRGVKK